MIKIFLPFLIIFSLNLYAETNHRSDKINQFCQDLNVVLQRRTIAMANISNHQTTRTAEGGPYKRLLIKECKNGFCKTEKDQASPLLIYMPNHPDTDENGYVPHPSYSIEEEKMKLEKANRIYDLLIQSIPSTAYELISGEKYQDCFKKYHFVREHFASNEYLGR